LAFEGRKIVWVRWENIRRPKEVGGLCIKDIDRFNFTLLIKWKWRLGTEKGELSMDVLESRYGWEGIWILW